MNQIFEAFLTVFGIFGQGLLVGFSVTAGALLAVRLYGPVSLTKTTTKTSEASHE